MSIFQSVLANFLYLILYLLYLLNPILAVADDRSCDSDDSMGGRGRSCSQVSQGNNRIANEEEATDNHYENVVLKDSSDGNSQEDVSAFIFKFYAHIFSYFHIFTEVLVFKEPSYKIELKLSCKNN